MLLDTYTAVGIKARSATLDTHVFAGECISRKANNVENGTKGGTKDAKSDTKDANVVWISGENNKSWATTGYIYTVSAHTS